VDGATAAPPFFAAFLASFSEGHYPPLGRVDPSQVV
jgi:hypothetical protein